MPPKLKNFLWKAYRGILLNGATRPDEAGSLAIDCTRIAQQISQLIIQHISRKGNEAAHRVARDSLNYNHQHVSLGQIPPSLAGFIEMDRSIS